MFKKLIPAGVLTIFWALSAGNVFAGAVVVEDDKIFVISANGLSVLELEDGKTAECSSDIDATISDGTDVVIPEDDDVAVVTINNGGSISVELVDVSACLDGSSGSGSGGSSNEECAATVDFDKGILEIPCLSFNGTMYEVFMEQRGNSSNWEVTFSKIKEENGNENTNENTNENSNESSQ